MLKIALDWLKVTVLCAYTTSVYVPTGRAPFTEKDANAGWRAVREYSVLTRS
jgi:hypothetical protein